MPLYHRRFSVAFGFVMLSTGYGAKAQTDSPKKESSPPALVSFCVMGDIPYESYEDKLLPLQIAGLPDDIPFSVHVGDIKRGRPPCDEGVYRKVAGMLRKSRAPVFIIPGDNEYNDCPDPKAAWKHWTTWFSQFDQQWKPSIPVSRQANRGENFAFIKNGVLFIGVNVVGGRKHDAEEWRTRLGDASAWVRESLRKNGKTAEAAVIFGHATPTPNQASFFLSMPVAAAEYGKPVAYIHGDAHAFFRDQPFPGAPNFYRIQIDRGGIAPPIRVSVRPKAKQPFAVDRRLDQQPAGYPRSEAEAREFVKQGKG